MELVPDRYLNDIRVERMAQIPTREVIYIAFGSVSPDRSRNPIPNLADLFLKLQISSLGLRIRDEHLLGQFGVGDSENG